MRRLFILFIFSLFFVSMGYAESKTIILKSGEKIIGECKELKDGIYLISTLHGELKIRETEVEKIITGKEESENKTENLISFLESKLQFLISVSKIDFSTERAKVMSEIHLKFGKDISDFDNDKELPSIRILPLLIYCCIFEILLPETFNVSLDGHSDYLGRYDLFSGYRNIDKNIGTVGYMVGYTKEIFNALKTKETFFNEFQVGKFVSKKMRIKRVKESGKNGLKIDITSPSSNYKKFFFFVIGSALRRDSVAFCEKIVDTSQMNNGSIFVENDTVRGEGLKFFGVFLK